MAVDIDDPPIYDVLTKQRGDGKDIMSDVWTAWMSFLAQTISDYISSTGFFLPNLTTQERDSLQNPQNAQTIYNTTVDAPQFWQTSSSSWRTVTFT